MAKFGNLFNLEPKKSDATKEEEEEEEVQRGAEKALFDVIKDCTSSADCHVKMALFIAGLTEKENADLLACVPDEWRQLTLPANFNVSGEKGLLKYSRTAAGSTKTAAEGKTDKTARPEQAARVLLESAAKLLSRLPLQLIGSTPNIPVRLVGCRVNAKTGADLNSLKGSANKEAGTRNPQFLIHTNPVQFCDVPDNVFIYAKADEPATVEMGKYTFDFANLTCTNKTPNEVDDFWATALSAFNAEKRRKECQPLSGRFTYDVAYDLGANVALKVRLMEQPTGGWGANRAEQVEPADCLWKWGYTPDDTERSYEHLPQLLLDSEKNWDEVAKRKCGPEGPFTTKPQPFSHVFIVHDKANYVLTNTPSTNIPQRLTAAWATRGKPPCHTSSSLAKESESVAGIFDFEYYRKVDNGQITVSDAGQQAKGETEQPKAPALPISLRVPDNAFAFKKWTGFGAGESGQASSIKNKGNPLKRSVGVRKTAGSVMGTLHELLPTGTSPGTKSYLSATVFANWLLEWQPAPAAETTTSANAAATAGGSGPESASDSDEDDARVKKKQRVESACKNALMELKGRKEVGTQEWCHLMGHGDGGGERLGNFVSGSYHCNTEQLAIETGQRVTTHKALNGFSLRTTAYLFPNNPGVLTQDYLSKDPTYNSERDSKQHATASAQKPGRRTDTGMTAPLASFIRYKIYKDNGHGTTTKVFDHIFEGQSEFFDRHQFNILSHAARFAVAGLPAFEAWYKEKSAALSPSATTTTPANGVEE